MASKKKAEKPAKNATKKADLSNKTAAIPEKLRSATETAELLGISRQWLLELGKRGILPRRPRGYPWPTVRVAFNDWLESKGETRDMPSELKAERTQLLRTQRQLLALDLAEKQGELIRRSAAVGLLERICEELRSQILTIPKKWSSQLVGLSRREIEVKLRDVIHDALEALSKGKEIPHRQSTKKRKAG